MFKVYCQECTEKNFLKVCLSVKKRS